MNEQQLPLTQALGFTTEPFDKNLPAKHLFVSTQIKQLFSQLKLLLQRRGIALAGGVPQPVPQRDHRRVRAGPRRARRQQNSKLAEPVLAVRRAIAY